MSFYHSNVTSNTAEVPPSSDCQGAELAAAQPNTNFSCNREKSFVKPLLTHKMNLKLSILLPKWHQQETIDEFRQIRELAG